MQKFVFDVVTFDEIAAMDLEGHPFLHEQGQVVLRGFVQSLDISEEGWDLRARDIELLEKYAGVWSQEKHPETYSGQTARTSFYLYRVKHGPVSEVSVHLSCYGSMFHIGRCLKNPWQDNVWPELDTEFLPSDLVTAPLDLRRS